MRALLDVNVLIALLDDAHVHHQRAKTWLSQNIRSGWASCPLTQNGCIRIMSQSGYSKPAPIVDVAGRLREAQATSWHAFWPDDLSVLDAGHIRLERLHGPAQITDAYLLALAVENKGRLVTFDDRIAIGTVPGATSDHLLRL